MLAMTSPPHGSASTVKPTAGGRPVALITGASSGLGAGFARALAERGHDLVLVARDEPRLRALADELGAKSGASAEIVVADLATEGGRAAACRRLASGVDVLVNNAGFGTSGEFWTTEPAVLKAQLDVNVTAVMELTLAALPPMIARARGTVINVASVAGLLAGRGSTYSASKAYVITFTEGLAGGLAGTGVKMQALCPGFVRTEFHERAGIEMSTIPGFMWLAVDDVVRASLDGAERGEVLSVPGLQYKAIVTATRLVPRRLTRRLASLIGRGRGRT